MKMPQVITDFNTFVDGKLYAGVANKVTIPAVIFETIEKDLAGNAGAYEVFTGQIGKLESELQFDTFAAKEIFKLVGDGNAANIPVIVRGSLKEAGQDIGLKITFQGIWKSWDGIELTKKGEVQNKFKVSLRKLVIESDGDELLYVNMPTWDVRMNGNDIGKKIKANLGL